ncbi:hypothetical protein U27_00287 [Candidatus Vecturithrix granuli]|uniref:Uncharacterized protein n=1 Tax=Vecturithrix granuli TaxID=1499967 RepID=A0A081C741_VECG1|nr:hypothetical protein U27_00287 [Candidatus Vecturithrix granuli]
MPNYEHCLRPVFTERIVQLLQCGRSVNLIGAEGTGRERLLDDIRTCELPETTIISVNLKSYQENYDGLMREIWVQTGKTGEQAQNLSALIEQCEHRNGQIFLLLYNFDALLGDPHIDSRYDVAFYDALNACKNRANIALLCVTEQPHDQSMVFVNGKAHSNSWLDLERKAIPALTHEEIVLEVQRQPLALMRSDQSALINAVRTHTQPYKLLEYLRDKILNREDGTLPFQSRLKKWIKQFDKTENERLLSKKGIYNAAKEMTAWGELTGVNKLKTPFLLLGNLGKAIAEILGKYTRKE